MLFNLLCMYMDKKHTDALPQSMKDSVRQFYKDHCTESPNAKDRMHRRKGVRNFEYTQKLIMNCMFDELYSSTQKMYPYMRISRTSFYLLRPWKLRMRHCKRETCLCCVCENYSGYTATLTEVGKLLEDAYTTNDEDDEMDADTTATERECVDRPIKMLKGSWHRPPIQNLLSERQGKTETVTRKTHLQVKARRNWPGRPAGRERTNRTKQPTRDPEQRHGCFHTERHRWSISPHRSQQSA